MDKTRENLNTYEKELQRVDSSIKELDINIKAFNENEEIYRKQLREIEAEKRKLTLEEEQKIKEESEKYWNELRLDLENSINAKLEEEGVYEELDSLKQQMERQKNKILSLCKPREYSN